MKVEPMNAFETESWKQPAWTRCKPVELGEMLNPIGAPEYQAWQNDRYYGSFRTFASGFPIGGGPYAVIGITANDETARHDWRDFQQIKNDLVGDEWEAVELYPAESRLVDPSNRFFLWCVPKGVFTFGFDHRNISNPEGQPAGQRPYAPGNRTSAEHSVMLKAEGG